MRNPSLLQISCQVITMQVSGNTFIWCIWRTCYFPSQLCEVIAHQFYFYLVFTCLWVWANNKETIQHHLFYEFTVLSLS